MSTYMKSGQPWLFDSTSGDIVGVKDVDGGETFFGRVSTDANNNTVLSGAAGEVYSLNKQRNSCVLVGDSITAFHNPITTSVSITSAGLVATATQSNHQLAVGQQVRVFKSTRSAQDGWVPVASTADANTFTYALETADSGVGTASVLNPLRGYDRGWFTWVNPQLENALVLLRNEALSGDTTSEILVRIDDAAALNAAFVYEMSGINDIINDVSMATILSNKEAIYQAILDSGATLVALTTTPLGSLHASFSAARTQAVFALNDWIKAYARDNENVILVDACAAIIDPVSATGDALTGYLSADNLHPSVIGAKAIADKVVTAMSGKVPVNAVRPISVFDDVAGDAASWNRLTNGMMQGTAGTHVPSTGGSTGPVPDGWTARHTVAAGSSCGTSVDARADGFGNDFTMVCVATASGQTFEARSPAFNTAVVAGDTISYGCEVTVSGATAMYLISHLNLFMGGLTVTVRSLTPLATTGPAAYTLVLETEPVTLSATPTNAYVMLQAKSSGVGGATVKIGRAFVRKH